MRAAIIYTECAFILSTSEVPENLEEKERTLNLLKAIKEIIEGTENEEPLRVDKLIERYSGDEPK